jgi:hypothetical protein
LRVVCGVADTIASCSPRAAFKNVDLPTFGLPTMAAVPLRCSGFGLDWFFTGVSRAAV